MKRCFTLIFILCSVILSGLSQNPGNNYIRRTFTEKEGLANNSVFIIRQDHSGFLWIATWDGLSRFDGYRFRNYYHDPSDSTTIPYFYLHKLCIDSANNVWVVGDYKLVRYDRHTDQFRRYRIRTTGKAPEVLVRSIGIDRHGVLHVNTSHGLFRWQEKTGTFTRITELNKPGPLPIPGYISMDFDDENNLWMSDLDTVFIRGHLSARPDHKFCVQFDPYYRAVFYRIKSENFISDFHVHGNAKSGYLITTNLGCYAFDSAARCFREVEATDGQLLPGFNSNFSWCREDQGIFFAKQGVVRHISVSEDGMERATSVLIDRDHTIWYGSKQASGQGTGLHQVMERKNPWVYLPAGERSDFEKLAVYSILEDSWGNIWLTSKHDTKVWKINPEGKIDKISILPDMQTGAKLYPRDILEDVRKNIWVVYSWGYLFKSEGNSAFRQVYRPPFLYSVSHPYMSRILEKGYESNTMLIVGGYGLEKYDIHTNEKTGECGYRGSDFYSVCDHPSGNYFIGGNGILLRISRDMVLREVIKIAGSSYNIEEIVPADSSKLWLALLGGGLCLYDLTNGHQQIFSTRNGLSNNVIYSILKDNHGKLWLSTNNGIAMFNPETQTFVNYGEIDGLKIREFNSDAAFKKSDGSLMFGGMGGIVAFHPDSLTPGSDTAHKNLLITGIEYFANGKSIRIADPGTSIFTADKGVKNIRITFAEVNFLNQQKSGFRYRIAGLIDEWTAVEPGKRTIEIAGLHPGRYELLLAASDVSGNWSKNTPLTLIIPPFYYETWWFKILAETLAALVILVFILVRVRHMQLVQRNRVSNLRQLAMQEQMNPHFVSNSLIAIESFSAQGDEAKTNEYISRLYSLMRRMIDYGGKEFVPFDDELALLKDYLDAEKMRVGFDYTIELTAGCPDNLLIAPSFVQPLIENAIRHGVRSRATGAGKIALSFGSPGPKKLQCRVTDNGKGTPDGTIPKEGASVHSKGLRIIRERLGIYQLLMKENFSLSAGPVSPGQPWPGMAVTIDIPVKYE